LFGIHSASGQTAVARKKEPKIAWTDDVHQERRQIFRVSDADVTTSERINEHSGIFVAGGESRESGLHSG
jgi:hypothetical protein